MKACCTGMVADVSYQPYMQALAERQAIVNANLNWQGGRSGNVRHRGVGEGLLRYLRLGWVIQEPVQHSAPCCGQQARSCDELKELAAAQIKSARLAFSLALP